MTDNRTTELREKLTERGIEYTMNDHMGSCETSWCGFTATQLSPNANLIMAVTPEQAIAATMGSERIHELESLVRDMWEFGESSNYPYTPLESVRWAQMREEYRERIAALGMEVDE